MAIPVAIMASPVNAQAIKKVLAVPSPLYITALAKDLALVTFIYPSLYVFVLLIWLEPLGTDLRVLSYTPRLCHK